MGHVGGVPVRERSTQAGGRCEGVFSLFEGVNIFEVKNWGRWGQRKTKGHVWEGKPSFLARCRAWIWPSFEGENSPLVFYMQALSLQGGPALGARPWSESPSPVAGSTRPTFTGISLGAEEAP